MLLSTDDYLKLVAGTLSADVMPAVQGKAAAAALTASIDALRELLKRREVLPSLATRILPQGEALDTQMPALLRTAGAQNVLLPPLATGEHDAVTRFAALMARLDAGAKALVARRGGMTAVCEQDATTWLRAVAHWENDYYSAFFASGLPNVVEAQKTFQSLTPEKLERHLQARLPERKGLRVTEFESFPGGFTNETFFFTLESSGMAPERLVVRKNSPRPFFAFWAHRAREEFQIVRRVADAGLPVPRPLWLFIDLPDVDGDFYVMTRGLGRMVGNLKGATETVPESLLLSLAEFFARLHAVPLANFADYLATGDTPVKVGDTVEAAVAKNVAFLHHVWSSADRLPSPAEAYTIDWLRRNVPRNRNTPVVVHTDCFVHNFLVADGKIDMVVDWEAAHFGDPAEDIAYVKDQVSASMDWNRFMTHYRACGGQPVDEASLDYYKCLLNFRNYFGTNIAVTRIPRGLRDIRMVPLGSEYFAIFMRACIEAARGTS